MALPKMTGNFDLTKDGINKAVTYVSPGAYNLEYAKDGTFYVERVGCSDVNLNGRLHDYEGQYKQFQYAYADNAEQAFYMECELWHAYGGSNNPLHPARPANTNYKCPVAGCKALL